MKKIILISAKAESGKDTVAEYMKQQLENQGYKVAIDRFAKYIKSYLKDYYGWDGVTKDEFIRQKLQILGTEIIKEKLNYKCFHAKRLAEDFQINENNIDFFIVSDTRFPDEIRYMQSMFPYKIDTLRINRNNFKSKLTKEQLEHKSETALDEFAFDYYIRNDKDILALYRQIDNYLEELLLEEWFMEFSKEELEEIKRSLNCMVSERIRYSLIECSEIRQEDNKKYLDLDYRILEKIIEGLDNE